MNNHYIQSLDEEELAARCVHFLTEEGLSVDPDLLRRAMPIVRERMKTLTEAPILLRFLFTDDVRPNEKAADLIAKAPEGYLKEAAEALDALEGWDTEHIQAALDALASAAGLSRTKGWQPVRAAVTGSNVSPPLPESLALLGRERTVARLRAAAGWMTRRLLSLAVSVARRRRRSHARSRSHARAPGAATAAVAAAEPLEPDVASLRPPIVWKPIPYGDRRRRQMAAYSQRHYGSWRWRLEAPVAVVEHYTTGTTWQGAWNTFAANSKHLGRVPGHVHAFHRAHRRHDLSAGAARDPLPPHDRDEPALDRDRARGTLRRRGAEERLARCGRRSG